MTDELAAETIQCPKCGSFAWYCWDERTRDCWSSTGSYMGVRVIGGLRCEDCQHTWLDYSVDPAIGETDCECEEWD